MAPNQIASRTGMPRPFAAASAPRVDVSTICIGPPIRATRRTGCRSRKDSSSPNTTRASLRAARRLALCPPVLLEYQKINKSSSFQFLRTIPANQGAAALQIRRERLFDLPGQLVGGVGFL